MSVKQTAAACRVICGLTLWVAHVRSPLNHRPQRLVVEPDELPTPPGCLAPGGTTACSAL
eukprot:scaffold8575_cov33-Prasinocladus_malaysianus.AAC.1